MSAPKPLLLYALLAVFLLYAPVLLLLLFSFNDSQYIAFPLQGFTVRWYAEMAGNAQLLQSLLNSLRVGAVASIAATLLAMSAARAIARGRIRGGAAIVSLVSLPMIMPEVILGVSLLIVLLGAGLPLSLLTVTLGHIVICTPYALAIMLARFSGYDPSYEEAARDLGDGPLAAFRRVTLPLVWPGVAASLLLCFLISFDDFVVSFFLSGAEQTLPVYIYSQLRFPARLPGVLALGVCVMAASIALIVLAEALRRRGEAGRIAH